MSQSRQATYNGKFLFGKYKDRYVSDIADEDPRYLEWFLDNVEGLSRSETRMIKEVLAINSRG